MLEPRFPRHLQGDLERALDQPVTFGVRRSAALGAGRASRNSSKRSCRAGLKTGKESSSFVEIWRRRVPTLAQFATTSGATGKPGKLASSFWNPARYSKTSRRSLTTFQSQRKSEPALRTHGAKVLPRSGLTHARHAWGVARRETEMGAGRADHQGGAESAAVAGGFVESHQGEGSKPARGLCELPAAGTIRR